MIVSRVQKQPKVNKIVVIPQQATPPEPVIVAASEPQGSAAQRQIKQRAFEIFEERGSKPGHDLQDWFSAEHQVLAS